MPWTEKQHRLFAWVAHNPQAAHAKGYDIPQHKAAEMMREGVKHETKRDMTARLLMEKKHGRS